MFHPWHKNKNKATLYLIFNNQTTNTDRIYQERLYWIFPIVNALPFASDVPTDFAESIVQTIGNERVEKKECDVFCGTFIFLEKEDDKEKCFNNKGKEMK